MTDLFSPIVIKNKIIKNRIIFPPIARFGWSDSNGFVSKKHIENYENIAKDGPGIIIIEGLAVSKNGRCRTDQLGIWSDKYIEGIGKIAEVCHKHGAIVTAQIHHGGLTTPNSVSSQAVAPSDYNENGYKIARALELKEINDIQQAFLLAANRIMKAGFDGVEIHGAHGYLLGQFMSPLVNKRGDRYGGEINNRVRFSCEIIREIKNNMGSKDFIIGYRMGGNEPTLKDGIKIAIILENAGVDLLHVSSGIEGDALPETPKDFKYNWIVYCGTEIKKNVNIPVIAVNGIRTPGQAGYLIKNNMVDFVAIGKGLLCDSNWTKKARGARSVIQCLECKECNLFRGLEKCPRYSNQFKSKSI